MALLDPLYRIADICAYHGIEYAVVSPGSRSAALTLAFNRNASINTTVIVDERSAGFVALGMAQKTKKPVVLICTSGTAALNYSPAVAEAYFQGTPLLILTADRPPEWINQHDGQTIFQRNVFGRHVIKAYELPVDYSHKDSIWHLERIVNEGLSIAANGPVHINIPIREPFYPNIGEEYAGDFRKVNYFSNQSILTDKDWQVLLNHWHTANKIIIAVGQNHENLNTALEKISKDPRVTIIADVISNVSIDNKISTHDTFILKLLDGNPKDLIITLGKSFISKPLKQYFRKNKPKIHWHVESNPELIDPFQSISDKILVNANYFFNVLAENINPKIHAREGSWKEKETHAKNYLQKFISNARFGELKATYHIIRNITPNEILHLGNSMPVRYVNILGCFLANGANVYGNRGTSGIDGIVSTAIGQAMMSDGVVHCLVGDVSFFYDSNALFAAKPSNLRIYLMNNSGGNIFRIIDGPKHQLELESHFITNPERTAESLCREADYQYTAIRTENELITAINNKESRAALFEIFLDGVSDSEIYRQLKAEFIL